VETPLGIAGSGAIATGLAAVAAAHADVILWARSDASADRARKAVEKACSRMEGHDPARVTVTTELADLGQATAIVEAISEEHDAKVDLLRRLVELAPETTLLATTTSSLSVEKLAEEAGSGAPGSLAERFCGLHVFNPVPRMKLVELVFPQAATEDTRTRARDLCDEFEKTAVEVPDIPGFIVNRLLFPYLFSAVVLIDETGLEPAAVDEAMKLGTGNPMGPLALLDFVGLDVSLAIGETIETEIPARLRELVGEGALGRKAGRGFYSYD
jgi:3-hydroxybutyryl-CoA dehydrogenase